MCVFLTFRCVFPWRINWSSGFRAPGSWLNTWSFTCWWPPGSSWSDVRFLSLAFLTPRGESGHWNYGLWKVSRMFHLNVIQRKQKSPVKRGNLTIAAQGEWAGGRPLGVSLLAIYRYTVNVSPNHRNKDLLSYYSVSVHSLSQCQQTTTTTTRQLQTNQTTVM